MKKETRSLVSLSERLLYALEITGIRKAELARAIQVKPQIIQFLCATQTMSSRFTFEIATALGLNTRWLATGEGEMFLEDDPKNRLLTEYKIVPLLENEELLALSKSQNYLDKKNMTVDNWIALKSDHNALFCTKNWDASMEPILPVNAIIFFAKVDPLKYTPQSGDLVLATIPAMNAVLIREFKVSHKKSYLFPKNEVLFNVTQYSEEIVLLGVVVEYHVAIKRE